MKTRAKLTLPALLVSLLAVGCAGAPAPVQESAPRTAEGARIWRMTCNRCHNLRPPTEYSQEEWPVIVRHMRTRADLSRAEAEAVTAFLQDAAERMGGS